MAICLVAVLLPTGGGTASPTASAASAQRPNVVVIMTDDMRADEMRYLPALRKLRRRGVTFTHARAADSLCCPTRATLLTGKQAHNHKTVGNTWGTHGGLEWFLAHNDPRRTVGPWMQAQGYRTAWIGKYLNDVGSDPTFDQPGWDHFAAPDGNKFNYYRHSWAVNGQPLGPLRGYRELYQRRWMSSLLSDWLPRRKPVFLVYNSQAPHSARVRHHWEPPPVEPQYVERAHSLTFRVPPSVQEDSRRELADKPQWVRWWAQDHPSSGPFDTANEQSRVGSLLSVNQTIRRAIRLTRASGELRNTLFVFTSDNGMQLGEHGLSGKNRPYEESTRIPLVLSGPGFRGGTTDNRDVAMSDVTATLLRAGGVRDVWSRGVDGLPLQKLRRRPHAWRQRPTLLEGSAAAITANKRPAVPVDGLGRFYVGVAWRGFTYVRYATGEQEFYNRRKDPWQMRNAYRRDAPRRSMQERMRRWLRGHLRCSGRDCNEALGR